MKFITGIRTLALSALIFSASCTSDGTESVETVEEENRIPAQEEEVSDSELPSPEAASIEAQETVDSNAAGDVQALPSDQQLAVDESANAINTGAGQEVAAASTEGAEVDATLAPAESPALPEAAPAVAEAPAESPAMPVDTAAAESAPIEGIPTIAETVGEAPSAEPSASTKKKGKKSRASRSAAAPTLSGNEKLYIVQPGDTLGSISSTLYGSSRQWRQLAELNNIDTNGRIFPGDSIKYAANETTAAFESRWDGMAKASVTVEANDTLSKIATRTMGKASFWKLLWRWNEAAVSDPNKINVGQTLQYVLPKDLEAATATGASETAAH